MARKWWLPYGLIFLAASLSIGFWARGGGGGDRADIIPPFWVPTGLVVADFDADGRVDIAVAEACIDGPPPHHGYVRVYRQSASGTFDAPIDYDIGPDPWGLSSGDLNGDGQPDLVAVTPAAAAPQINSANNSGGISILRQDPAHAGRFLPSQWVQTGGAANDAAIMHLAGKSLADVAVADGRNGRALLLEQDPARPRAFLAPLSLLTGSDCGAEDVAVGDVNGDGRDDIVLAAAKAVAVFYQNAGGGFDPVTLLGAGAQTSGVALADLDGNGQTDIVAVDAGDATGGGAKVTIFRQVTPGNFISTDIAVADGARRVAVDDLNGDGIPDIVVISLLYQSKTTSRVSVLLQSPTTPGQFEMRSVYAGPFSGNFIAIGDINGDGLNDIVVNDGPTVLLQRPAAPGSFEPASSLPLTSSDYQSRARRYSP